MNRKNRKVTMGVLLALLVAFGAGVVWAQGVSFRSILKVGGAIAVADRLGPQIDRTLRTATGQRNVRQQDIATKVVPVISVGNRRAVGIVQVSGDRAAVTRTQAVAQISTNVPVIGGSQARILIPVSTRNVSTITRVPGVGVSAVIDLKM